HGSEAGQAGREPEPGRPGSVDCRPVGVQPPPPRPRPRPGGARHADRSVRDGRDPAAVQVGQGLMEQLQDRVVFITGGAQGIGLGMARAFAAEGSKLVLADIDQAALDQVRTELGAAVYQLDVRDRAGWDAVVSDAESSVGPIDVLCNNAGVGGGASVSTMTFDMWDWVLDVNLGGVVNGIQTVTPRMIARGGGHIVNTGSGAGLAPVGTGGFMYAT